MSSVNEAGNPLGPPLVTPQAEEIRRLALRRREQLYYFRHLQRSRQCLQETSQALTTHREEAERQTQEFQRDRAAWEVEKARVEQAFAEQAQQLSQQSQELEAAREGHRQQQEHVERERSDLHQQRGQHLQELQANQAEVERKLAEVRAQVEAEAKSAMAKKEEEFDQALFELQRRQRQAILETENALAKKQEELDQALAELKQRPQTVAPAPAAEERTGFLDSERLQRLLAARNRELAKAAEEQQRDTEAFEKQREQLQAEIDGLRSQMAEKEAQVLALQVELQRPHEDDDVKTLPPAFGRQLSEKDDEIDRLKAEIGALRRLLASAREKKAPGPIPAEEDALTDAPRAEAPRIATPPPVAMPAVEAPPRTFDFADYEAELTEFRRQLEADRRDLDEQLQQIRQRQSDLSEAGGRAEVEISRERASLSRERAQLERMRADVRMDMERMQREGGTREALAAVHELNDRRQAHEPAPRNDSNSKGVGGLLRSLRSKFRDG